MKAAFLQCPWCGERVGVFFDPASGLWEIHRHFSKISHRNLQTLEREWLTTSHPECVQDLNGRPEAEAVRPSPPAARFRQAIAGSQRC